MTLRSALKSIALTAVFMPAIAAFSEEKVTFGTNWFAQPGHGGFYQAVIDGTCKRYGLDVEIVQGGPQVNNRPLLPVGKLDLPHDWQLAAHF